MGLTSYRVPGRSATATIEVKRSRFLCRIERVGSEDEARAVVEAARKEYWDARHHCSAFVLGPDSRVARSSDDGEPAGTAGAPMLEVLRGAEVSDTVAVVSRWFGGVLLGAGGLVRAYGDAVRVGLEAAGTQERRLRSLVAVTVSHGEAGRLENDLRARGHVVRGMSYAEAATLLLAIDPSVAVGSLLAELTGGSADWRPAGEEWVDG